MRPTSIIRAVAWAILAAGFLGLLFFGLHTFRMRLETSNSLPEYSTYRADPKGLKVLYESLRASDLIHVSRRLESSRILPSGEGQILIVAGVRADQETVSGEDVQWLDHWLTTGGRIVVALHPEQNQVTHSQAVSSANQEATEDTSSALWQSLIKRWGVEIVPLKDIRAATAESTLFGTISRWLGRNSFAQATPDWKVIAVQGPKNVIVERAFGHGSIVLLADSYPLSNESLAADRNTDFLLWLIDNRRGVLFDETHLGLQRATRHYDSGSALRFARHLDQHRCCFLALYLEMSVHAGSQNQDESKKPGHFRQQLGTSVSESLAALGCSKRPPCCLS